MQQGIKLGTDMQQARTLLRGVDVKEVGEDDDECLPQRGRPPKKLEQHLKIEPSRVSTEQTAVSSTKPVTSSLLSLPVSQALPSPRPLPPPSSTTAVAKSSAASGEPRKTESKRPKKYNTSRKRLALPPYKPTAESFVMKLFDRSLDLSKYTDKTPLFPICRAWMANQPRNPHISNYSKDIKLPPVREDNGKELYEKLRTCAIRQITAMPLGTPTDLEYTPKPLPLSKKELEDAHTLKGASKEQLLESHKKRWLKVRINWITHVEKYNRERGWITYKILDALHKR